MQVNDAPAHLAANRFRPPAPARHLSTVRAKHARGGIRAQRLDDAGQKWRDIRQRVCGLPQNDDLRSRYPCAGFAVWLTHDLIVTQQTLLRRFGVLALPPGAVLLSG